MTEMNYKFCIISVYEVFVLKNNLRNLQNILIQYVAEEFTGKRMETTINLMYLGSRQKEQFVSAHLTCVCPGTSTDVMCNEGKFIYNETILCGDQDC